MIRSMTAYGKGVAESPAGRIVAEIQSINRKHFDLNINLPKELAFFDPEIREWLKTAVGRGLINLRISLLNQNRNLGKLALNLCLLEQYKAAFEELQSQLNVPTLSDERFLYFLLEQPSLFSYESMQEDSSLKNLLKEAVDQALQNFLDMKVEEGQALVKDFSLRLKMIHASLESIEPIIKSSPGKYRDKLTKRLIEISENQELVDQRILVEVALFADKVDVSEEMTRFQSHLAHFDQLIHGQGEVGGKKLDFLLQELFREINTMNSKMSDLKGAQLCLQIKGELEKIREQVQNIE
ncbi:UPF0701 protein YloC [Chlamydiales bacterium STE3]|nr:UPF0701 protein YloC [Chlamydiales bacterium STE3]